MESTTHINFFMMTLILFGPLAWIYLILYTLNWNQRKNLFSDSWVIFIVSLISSFLVFIVFSIADVRFYDFLHLSLPFLFFPILVIVNTLTVATVLNYRENKKNLSVSINSNEEENQQIANEKILKTSAIVSILTIAMSGSLVMFVNEVSTKMREERRSRTNSGYVVYE